jgi:micrococcal nuclease
MQEKTLHLFITGMMLLLTLLSIGVLAAPAQPELPQPLTEYTLHGEIVPIKEGKYAIQRVDFWEGLVVFVGTLTNPGASICLSRLDFKLRVGSETYAMSRRSSWIEEAYGVQSPGTGFYLQCIQRDETKLVVLPFALTVSEGATELWYENHRAPFSRPLAQLKARSAIPLPTPTPTYTPTPTVTHTPTPAPTPTSTFTPAPAAQVEVAAGDAGPLPVAPDVPSLSVTGTVRTAGLEFRLARLDFWDLLPDGSQPNHELFLVLVGTLTRIEDGSNSHCVGADDVELLAGDRRYTMAEKLRAANRHYQSAYPGFILSQCPSSSSPTEATFFIFDVAVEPGPFLLSFHDALLRLPAPLPELKAAADGALVVAQATATAPLATARPPATMEPTDGTPIPTARPPTATAPTGSPHIVPHPDLEGAEVAIVIHVRDGNTVDALIDNRQQRVRYILIDVPKEGDPLFAEATSANFKLVGWQRVYLLKDQRDTDEEGHLLRYVYLPDGVHVNAELVRQGYAWVEPSSPNESRLTELRTAEAEARAAERGIWSGPTTPSP